MKLFYGNWNFPCVKGTLENPVNLIDIVLLIDLPSRFIQFIDSKTERLSITYEYINLHEFVQL